jgi:PAS domain S-box-containing protein
MSNPNQSKEELIIENKELKRQYDALLTLYEKEKASNKMDADRLNNYQQLVEYAPDAIAIYSDGKIVYVNIACLKILGATNKDQLLGKPVLDFVHPDYIPVVIERMKAINSQKIGMPPIEEKYIRLDGSEVFVEVNSIPILFENQQAVQLVGRDMSKRKQTEETVKLLLERLSLATKAGGIGIWDNDLINNKLVWDEQLYKIYGITADTFGGAFESWEACIHPEDIPESIRVHNMAYSGEKEYNTEFRVIKPNGEIRHIRSIATIIRDNHGKPIRMVGVNWDNTERIQSIEALRSSEEKFRIHIENSFDVIFTLNTDSKFLYVSPSWEKHFGFSSNDVIGKPFHLFIHTEDILPLRHYLNDILISGQNESSPEYRVKHANGNWLWYIANGTPYTDKFGNRQYIGVAHNITDKKLAIEALINSNKNYEIAISASRMGTWDWDIITNKLNWSEACKTMFGIPLDIEMNYDHFLNALLPEDREPANNKTWVALNEKINYDNEYRVLWPDGTKHWIKALGCGFYNEDGNPIRMTGVAMNIAESKLAHQALLASEKNFKELFEANTDGIIIFNINPDGPPTRVLDLNERAAIMVGYTKAEMLQKKPFDIEKGENLQIAEKRKFEIQTKGFSCFETILTHKNGSEIHVEINSTATLYNNQPALMNIVRNISERKKHEQQLQKLASELSKLNADKDKFISILAHDLKSPFNAILGFLNLLTINIREYDINKIESYLKMINTSTQNTYNLIEDTLLWINSQSGKIPYNPQLLNFTNLSEHIIEELHLYSDSKNITIINNSSNHIYFVADSEMIKTVLRNLISNAIKFSHKGGVVQISATEKKPYITISISDNGTGIVLSELDKLFNIAQVRTTNGTAGEKGTGLGLMICKEFIEMHNGRIWVESECGKGTKFIFTIPMKN